MYNTRKGVPIFTIVAILFCVGFLTAFLPMGKKSAIYEKITAEEAKRIMDSGKPFVLLDVRNENEYKTQRIDGAILIPHDKIKEEATEKLPNKDETILVYCRSGRRSAIAANELINMGYKNVYDFGGIIDWTYETIGD